LLSVPELRVRFNPFALEDQRLSFPLIRLEQPTIRIVQDSAGSNIDFLSKAFPKDTSAQPFSYAIDCRKIAINNARVRYIHRPSGNDVLVSDIRTDVGFTYAGQDSLSATLRQLHAKVQLARVKGSLEADFHGNLDTLYADKMQVIYRGRQIFDGDVCVHHLMQPDSLYAQLKCTDLSVNATQLSSLLADITGNPTQLPAVLHQLGTIHYRGRISGQPKDIRLRGAFLTRIGSVSTNLRLKQLKEAEGQIRTTNLSLNRLFEDSPLGDISADISFQGDLYDSLPKAKIDGTISKLEFKNYAYSNISFKADLSQKEELTSLSINDPNVQLQLLSHLTDWTTKSPTLFMDMQLPVLNLAALHLTDSLLEHSLSLSSTIALRVDSTIPNLVDGTFGSITIDSLHVQGAGHHLDVPKIVMEVEADSLQRHMSIVSPILTAHIDGHFQWTTIPATIYGFIHRSLPSLTEGIEGHEYVNDMDFSAEVLRADDILRVLGNNQLHFPTVPQLSGFVHESDSSFAIRVFSDQLITNNTAYQHMLLSLDNNNPMRNTTGSFYIQQHIIQKDSTRLKIEDLMASVQLIAHNDSVTTVVEFGALDDMDSVPDLLVHTTVSQDRHQPVVDVHFMPSDFQLGRAKWHVDDSHVTYVAADTAVRFDQLHVYTPQQMLRIHGQLSPRMQDSLDVQLQNIDLGYLLSSTKVLDALDFSGSISGQATVFGAFSTPQFEAGLTMQDAQINHVSLGCVTAQAELDHNKNEVILTGAAVKDGVHLADVTGRVTSQRDKYWEVYVDANGVPLDFVNYWTSGIVEQISGSAYGRVHIFGRNMSTWVTTRAYAKDASLVVPATGARYFFSDSIVMDTTYIGFPAVHLSDAQGHKGLLSGKLEHTCFQNFRFKLNAQCDNILGLDLPASSHSTYYGKAYAKGMVDIYGNEYVTHIDVNATTAANTDFYLSLATATSASSSEFITFVQATDSSADSLQTYAKPSARLLLNLAIEATPEAKVHLVLDEHNGDGIVGRGDGSIRLNLDATSGEAQMLGTYTLLNGTFSYTVGNLIHRDFTIAEGSTVVWSGDPANPKLDITARYRCTANLRDLFGADVKSITNRSSIPVDCVIHITGEMENMIMKFSIEFPQSDESVAAQINAVINTEAMLMRQVIYLLVFNRFYMPETLRATYTNAGLNDAYSLLSSTVTGQINSWLSKLTDMVNVGFNVRANVEQGGNQSYETEANIQIQPIARLTINGNVGYRYNDISNQPFFGDADIEYELTPDGKLRAKAFTHSVDKYSLHQTGMQSGIGFIFRHDFNPGDAKKRREAKKQQ